ncbi:unnamed protein product, partial [Boreogadus saida]
DKPVGKPRQRCLPGKKGEERNSRCNSRGAALFDGSTHIKMLRSTEVLAGTSKCVHTFIQAGEIVSKKRNRLNPKTVEKIVPK